MSKFMDDMKKDIQDNIRYKNTVMTGEITAVNNDGTYDVKIAQSNSSYPNVETMSYDSFFTVGEIVDIAFEYGTRESPMIMGTAKKIAQDSPEVEVDYSGKTGGGKQTETVTIYSKSEDGHIVKTGSDYSTVHDAENGDAVYEDDEGNVFWVGILYSAGGPPGP